MGVPKIRGTLGGPPKDDHIFGSVLGSSYFPYAGKLPCESDQVGFRANAPDVGNLDVQTPNIDKSLVSDSNQAAP